MNEMQRLSGDAVVGRRNGLVEAELDNEIVALNIESGMCYGLNRVGSRIWTLLASPAQISDLCSTLLAEYEVEPGVCEGEVLDLLEELRAEGLIAIVEEK